MSLLPSAPRVELRIPGVVFAGQPTAFEIDVIATDATKVDFIRATVRAHQGWSIGTGKDRITHRLVYPELAMELMGAGVLEAGRLERTGTFTLPHDIAPTHTEYPAYGKIQLDVHVSIPWWPDGRYHFAIPVRLPAHGETTRRPVVARSGNTPNVARLELSLASNRLIAGETVVGSCALFHVDDRKPRDIEIALVPQLVLSGRGRTRERTGTPIRMVFAMPAGTAGQDVQFRLQLPASLTPSFATRTHKLTWFLVAKTGSFFGPNVEVTIPLEIVDRSAAAFTPALAIAPPRVADEKVAAMFAAYAARDGWTEVSDRDESPAIRKVIGEAHTAISIGYTYRGEAGTALVARVEYPTLGLDLAVVPGSLLRHAFFHDIEVDDPAWDSAHHVTARSAAQALPFLRPVVAALVDLDTRKLATLVRIDDDAIVYERPIGALADADLVALGVALAPIARAVAIARAAIAPPPGLVADLAAWQALARELDGELVVGELAIDGAVGGVPASVSLVWDGAGAPRAIAAHVGDAEHASELVRRIAFTAVTPQLAGTGLPDGVAALLATWPDDVANLEVSGGAAAAELAIREGVADGAQARRALLALRALLAHLDPGGGPYR